VKTTSKKNILASPEISKIEAWRIMAPMNRAERREFLDRLFIFVAEAVKVSNEADQENPPLPEASFKPRNN
jgi:hypothetical protein